MLDTGSGARLQPGAVRMIETLPALAPTPAAAAVVSITLRRPSGLGTGELVVWPAGKPQPTTGVLEYAGIHLRFSGATITVPAPLDAAGRFNVAVTGPPVHVTVDAWGTLD